MEKLIKYVKKVGFFDGKKKINFKIYLEEDVDFFTTHVNPRKLLEKSGTKS
jgi:hypothetical protein